MAILVIDKNDSIYDYWFEDGQLYGSRKHSKKSFKIDSLKAYDILAPHIKALGIDPSKPTSLLLYIPEKAFTPHPPAVKIYKEEPKEESTVEKIQSFFNLLSNGISRKVNLFFGNTPEHSSKRIKPQLIQKKTTNKVDLNRKILTEPVAPDSYTINDTTRVNSRRYRLPESINLSQHTFGYRNRGNYTPIQSNAAPITTFFEFTPKENIRPDNSNYIGIDSVGHFVLGKYSDIPNKSMITRTFKNEVTGFKRDSNGNIIFTESNSNGSRKSPVLKALIKGKYVNNRFNVLSTNNRTDEYGTVAGGRVIVQAGKEIRLVSGSIDNISDEIEAMKARNKTRTVNLYTLDNGTYHSGLRTYDGNITRDDLLKYDSQNTGGGNFLYIQ